MKTPYSSKLVCPAVFAAAFVLSQASLNAELLVYEGFNYSVTNGASISGATSTATGTTGAWAVTNTGAASAVYQSAGLSFGDNFATSSGGALLLSSTYSGGTALTVASVKLNTAATGTLWSSYLANYTTMSLANGGYLEQGVGTSGTARATQFLNRVASNTLASDRKVVAAYDTAGVASPNTAFATSTNYLVLSRYTNVGADLTSGSGVATTWVFTEAGYNNWFTTGLGLEANLNAYALRVVSDTVGSGTYTFDSDKYLSLAANAPAQNGFQFTGLIDELRYGTDLGSVITAAIPEPSTYAMIAGGLGLVGAMVVRRRRSRA